MLLAEGDHPREEAHHSGVLLGQLPVEPADLVVLAVGVVVAALGAAELVAAQEHGDPLAGEEDGGEVLDLALAEPFDLGVVGGALDTAVPALVVVAPVPVVLAVGEVVLLVVADQIVEREPVVSGDEVDAVGGQLATPLVEVGAAAHAEGDRSHQPGVALHEAPDVVAVMPVPLRPPGRREATDLVQAARVPRLGDDLGVGEDRGELDAPQRGGHRHLGTVLAPGEDRPEVEAEAVDVVLPHPVLQALDDELGDHRVVGVQGVAAPRVVHVVLLVGRVQVVVGLVGQAPEADRGAVVVPLPGVVEHHVEDHLDAGPVQRLHHVAELAQVAALFRLGAVVGLGREVPVRVVAPVVVQRRALG